MKNLAKLLIAIITFFMKVKEDMEDGKISRSEAWGLVMNAAMAAWNPIVNFSEIKDAVKDVIAHPDSRAELKALVAEDLDLPDDELEERIEQGLDLIDRIYTYVRSWLPVENQH